MNKSHNVERRKLVIKEWILLFCFYKFPEVRHYWSTASLPSQGGRSLFPWQGIEKHKLPSKEERTGSGCTCSISSSKLNSYSSTLREWIISESWRGRVLYSWGSLHIRVEKTKSTLKKKSLLVSSVSFQSTFPHMLLS